MAHNPKTKTVESSRRQILKSCAALAPMGVLATSSANALQSNSQSPSPSNNYYSFDSQDTNDRISGYLETGFLRYDAESLPGMDNWKIVLEVSSQAVSQDSIPGIYDWIHDSFIKATWPDKANHDVYSDLSQNTFYTGASTALNDTSRNSYAKYADPAVNYARGELIGLVPYSSEIMTVGQTVDHLIDDFAGGSGGKDKGKIKKKFDWRDTIHDVGYWVKFEASGPPSGSLLLDVRDRSNDAIPPTYKLETNTPVMINFPDIDPPDSGSLSKSELQSKNISVVSSSELRQNPTRWGVSAETVRNTEEGPMYIYNGDPSNDARLRKEIMHNKSI